MMWQMSWSVFVVLTTMGLPCKHILAVVLHLYYLTGDMDISSHSDDSVQGTSNKIF